MRSNRHMGVALSAMAAMLANGVEVAAGNRPSQPKTITGTKRNPERQTKAQKKRERKNAQRLKLAGR